MKRFFVVAAIAVMMAAPAVWAADMCLWNGGGDCWPLADATAIASCEKDAWHFNGGTEGKGTFCSGGTFIKGKSTTPPAAGGNTTPLGCCKWDDGSGKCWNVFSQDEVSDCSGKNELYSGACPDDEGTCPGGSVVPPAVKEMCLWNAAGDCWPTSSEAGSTIADCEKDAWHFTGGTEGKGTFCSGGTFVKGKTNTPPDGSGNTTPLGCCKWSSETNAAGKCWTLYEESEVTDCGYTPNQLWTGACPDDEGTCPSGPPTNGSDAIRLLNPKAATPGLKVSYAKNRVTVNWSPTAKISGGTVQLINAKGAAMSTAYLKAGSGKVSVKLGTSGVPTGMYFIHINAVGQNGQKIVTQSAVSIVK